MAVARATEMAKVAGVEGVAMVMVAVVMPCRTSRARATRAACFELAWDLGYLSRLLISATYLGSQPPLH